MTRHVGPGWAISLLVVLGLGGGLVWASDATTTPSAPRPEWCQKGYVCIPTRDAADLTIRLADLEADLAAARANRARRWGWFGVCGPSASLQVVDSKWDVAGTISCTVGVGVRLSR